ncbi:MAG: TonB-dependent receptor [Bacteroidales bacterium]|nr:TonB-dependent receptor [Bacteroidales bacterium]
MRRNTEKVYVYRAEGGAGGWLTGEELESLPDLVSPPIDTTGGVPSWAIPYNGKYYYSVYDPDDEVDKMLPNPRLSRNRNSVNGYLYYDMSEEVSFGLKSGIQYSDIISTSMGDNPMAHVGRESRTSYIDFNAKIKGLRFQTNYLFGWQDIIKQDTGFKVDIGLLNANAEYDFNFGGFNLRPGISFQQAKYDDTPYISTTARGFLNSERDFESTAFSLRGDYTIADRIRLIAAGRGEKYSTNDKLYFSYQLIASYNLNDKHYFRVLRSRANRGPFLVDTYADYYWERDGRPTPGYIYFQGQKNMDLLTMTMNEFGYRVKPLKNIQADLEVFYTKSVNYGALYPDSVQFDNSLGRHWVRMSFDNISMESEQIGVSANISWVAKQNLIVKLYGTWQQTKLTGYLPIGQEGTIDFMLQDAALSGGSSTNFPKQLEDGDHKATPAFYGGFIVNYSPIEKLTCNINGYFYSKQEFYTKYNPMDRTENIVTIDPKVIVNIKVNYQLINTLDLFINARNIIGEKQEFGYMDDIGTLFLIGLNYNLN